MGFSADEDAALDAAIAGTGLAAPDEMLVAVRDGIRRLRASVERLRAAGFEPLPTDETGEAGR